MPSRNILLDECLDRKFADKITGYSAQTVAKAGWASFKNGNLLQRAQADFDISITAAAQRYFKNGCQDAAHSSSHPVPTSRRRVKVTVGREIHSMQTVEQIQSNIEALPRAEYIELFHWLHEREAEEWNREIENDASAGRLDFLMEEAKPHATQRNLYEAYRNMAADHIREAEAIEWAEITCEDLNHAEG